MAIIFNLELEHANKRIIFERFFFFNFNYFCNIKKLNMSYLK